MADWPPIISAIAGSLSAIAGATAAGAAWFAALQSKAAAQDVRQALGISMKPEIDVVGAAEHRVVGGEPPVDIYTATIRNHSLWAAVDVEIEAVLRDGSTLRARMDRIEGATAKGQPHEARLDLGDPPVEPFGVGITEPGDRTMDNTIVIRYRDERRLLRWEHVWKDSIYYTYMPGRGTGKSFATSSSERMIES